MNNKPLCICGHPWVIHWDGEEDTKTGCHTCTDPRHEGEPCLKYRAQESDEMKELKDFLARSLEGSGVTISKVYLRLTEDRVCFGYQLDQGRRRSNSKYYLTLDEMLNCDLSLKQVIQKDVVEQAKRFLATPPGWGL